MYSWDSLDAYKKEDAPMLRLPRYCIFTVMKLSDQNKASTAWNTLEKKKISHDAWLSVGFYDLVIVSEIKEMPKSKNLQDIIYSKFNNICQEIKESQPQGYSFIGERFFPRVI